ncbi:asparagine synthase-related protein [Thioalkalivibrio sp.]|uniref:asparagine synthase-related protein n=1 Tax=Thioalkalivibrio sp. TaxID=2093813 RepID=UPI0039768ABE
MPCRTPAPSAGRRVSACTCSCGRCCGYWPTTTARRRWRSSECLRETVASHLLSDVRVGTFLSGGLDSTTIGAMMARQLPGPVPAFSIGVDEASFDELGAAEQVARAEGMVFHGERVKADVASMLPMMVHHLGEPVDPYAVGVYLVSRLAARHVKVTLSGDGGTSPLPATIATSASAWWTTTVCCRRYCAVRSCRA